MGGPIETSKRVHHDAMIMILLNSEEDREINLPVEVDMRHINSRFRSMHSKMNLIVLKKSFGTGNRIGIVEWRKNVYKTASV